MPGIVAKKNSYCKEVLFIGIALRSQNRTEDFQISASGKY